MLGLTINLEKKNTDDAIRKYENKQWKGLTLNWNPIPRKEKILRRQHHRFFLLQF